MDQQKLTAHISDITPFCMLGNVYFVGSRAVSVHIIDTGAGLIMIDSGYPYTQEQRDEICLYLNKAGEAFAHAEEASAEDILWKGYITFNRARIDLIRALMENRFAAGWDQSINAAVDARYAVCKLFAPQGEPSFLHAELEKEYHYARALRLSMHCFLRTDDAVQEQARQIVDAYYESKDSHDVPPDTKEADKVAARMIFQECPRAGEL